MSKQNAFPAAINTMKTTDDFASVLRFFVNIMLKESVAEVFQKAGGIEALSVVLPKILQKKDKESLSLVFLLINNLLILTKPNNFKMFAISPLYDSFAIVLKESAVDDETLEVLVKVIVNLSSDDSNRRLLTQRGIPSLLFKLLPKMKNQQLQETARTSIANLMSDENVAGEVMKSGEAFTEILSGLDSSNEQILISSLSSVINLGTQDDVLVKMIDTINKSTIWEKLIKLLNSKSEKVKCRSIWAIGNLISLDSLQETFVQKGGLDAIVKLLNFSKQSPPPSEDIKHRVIVAVFHMTLYNDNYRKKIVEQDGLKFLTAIISKSSNLNDAIRTDALKTVVNLSLTEENEPEFVKEQTIQVLVKILGENNGALQELASLTLENLSFTPNLTEQIRLAGVVEPLEKLLQTPQTQERAAKLLTKLSTNSKLRKQVQGSNIMKLLQSLEKSSNAAVAKAASTALMGLSIAHFEDEKPPTGRTDEFAEFRAYLESEGESDGAMKHSLDSSAKLPEKAASTPPPKPSSTNLSTTAPKIETKPSQVTTSPSVSIAENRETTVTSSKLDVSKEAKSPHKHKNKTEARAKKKEDKREKKIKQSKQTHETKNQSGGEPTISSQQQQQEPAKDTASTETMIQPELQSMTFDLSSNGLF